MFDSATTLPGCPAGDGATRGRHRQTLEQGRVDEAERGIIAALALVPSHPENLGACWRDPVHARSQR